MEDSYKGLPILHFANQEDWAAWLAEHHANSAGVWVKLARKSSGLPSASRDEVLDLALCYGWIDSQGKSLDEQYWLQKFTPRRAQSKWSKVNRVKVEQLIAEGRMQPAGLAAIEAAKADGRWDAAYDPPSTSTIPPDLQEALDQNPAAAAFFATLNSANRYAILHRIQTVKKAETRARRIRGFVEMLERNEKLYP